MDIWPGGIPDGDALVKAALQHEMIQRSPLVRVVAIGKAVEDDGVVLELIALEIRDVGAVLYWKAQPVGEYVLGGPDFVVTDDVGTVYTFLLPTWVSSEGVAKGNTDLVPPPPVKRWNDADRCPKDRRTWCVGRSVGPRARRADRGPLDVRVPSRLEPGDIRGH
jgi:hypothetical protein